MLNHIINANHVVIEFFKFAHFTDILRKIMWTLCDSMTFLH